MKDIGIRNDKVLSELAWKNKFMELFFVVFYAANSLMKRNSGTETLQSMKQVDCMKN